MSGFTSSARSPWFGDSRTSATTQESGRNSVTNKTIREPRVESVVLPIRNTGKQTSALDVAAVCAGTATRQQAPERPIDVDMCRYALMGQGTGPTVLG